jgi:hypothetical protein
LELHLINREIFVNLAKKVVRKSYKKRKRGAALRLRISTVKNSLRRKKITKKLPLRT